MPTISTSTELANLALAHIGKVPIDDIDDNTESAEICKAFYPIVRQIFLRQSKLHISRKEVALALAAGETSNVYTYVYGVPADIMFPIKIWNGDTSAAPIIYEINTHSSLTSSVLKTDYADAILIYAVDITNLTRYSADDVLAMSFLFASFIAMPLKVDKELKVLAQNDYIVALSVAIANDKNAQSIDVVNNSRFSSIEDSRQT